METAIFLIGKIDACALEIEAIKKVQCRYLYYGTALLVLSAKFYDFFPQRDVAEIRLVMRFNFSNRLGASRESFVRRNTHGL